MNSVKSASLVTSDSRLVICKSLKLYLAILLGLTILGLCTVGVRKHILHDPYPRNSLFVQPEYRFNDFTYLADQVARFGEINVLTGVDSRTPFPYPAPSIFAYLFFVRLFPHPLTAYLVFILLVFVAATCAFCWRLGFDPAQLPQLAVWATLFFGFPLWFLIDRGNIEAIVWLLVLLGTYFYTKNRMAAAAILLAAAASMKIFPGLLFLLFLAKRKYGAFALAVVATGLITLGTLKGVGPTVHQALSDNSKGASALRDVIIQAQVVPWFDHSAFGLVKQGIYCFKYANKDLSSLQSAFGHALKLYSIVIPVCALLLYLLRLRQMPILNQFVVYLVLCILLPYVSYEYTLIYLYLAWAVFLLFLLEDVLPGRVQIAGGVVQRTMISCAVIFSPLSFLIFGHGFGVGGQIKTIFLLIILWTFLRVPMPSSVFSDLPNTYNSETTGCTSSNSRGPLRRRAREKTAR
jgi:Glycosyltransferase family 87